MYERLNKKNPQNNRNKLIVPPRVITIMQKCVEHNVQDCLIQRLHFNDLYVLLLSLDIADLKQAINQQRNSEMKKRNVDIKDIAQEDALKYLKGG